MSRSLRTLAASAGATGKSQVFSEEFGSAIAWGSKWTGHKSSIMKNGTNNPDQQLDLLTTDAVSVSDGLVTFTATPSSETLASGRQAWNTGLLTTEYTAENFQVKTGDYAEVRVKLPTATGAWPCFFSWQGNESAIIADNNEIDTFEYHPDNPEMLELTNHINNAVKYHTDAAAIGPGAWVTLGTHYGENSVDWYINGQKVFSDGTGVGSTFTGNLVLDLQISNGNNHPAPSNSDPITFQAEYVRVYR